MKFLVHTYGCQMNERDSEAVAVLLERHGFTRAAGESAADLFLVNTCSVRGKAEGKALGKLHVLAFGKDQHPDRIVGAVGCMVQRMGEELFRIVPRLDFAVGPRNLSELPDVIARVRSGERPVLRTAGPADVEPALDGHPDGSVCAYVNILQGCDRHCTYCVVPGARGSEYSRPAGEVLTEVRGIVDRGGREVTLLGQSVMSYGRRNAVWPASDVSPRGLREPFPRLLEAVGTVPGLERVRFMSGHPSGCTDELVRVMCEIPSICEQIHLPLQSGSDRILAAMRRGYTAAEYTAAVRKLQGAVPNLAVTTDIIVGFPGETDADFEVTRRMLDEIGFDNVYVFKYSPRPGTVAAGWADDIPDAEKMRRNKVLLADQNRRSVVIRRAWVGKPVEVLVEGVSLRNCERWSGKNRLNWTVVFDPVGGMKAGDLVNVQVERVTAQTLYGRIV